MINDILLGAVLISAFVTGLVIHELTHFAVGLWDRSLREVSIVFPNTDGVSRYVPMAVVVSHSYRNWRSTLGPLVWLLPFWAVLQVAGNVPPLIALHLLSVFGIAGFTVIISDIPNALGLFNYGDESRYRRVVLVDYTHLE